MAALTTLQAVNELLESIGEWPTPALASTGSWPTKAFSASIYGQAEATLDRVRREVLTPGLPDNTEPCATLTVAAGNITLASNVLRVQAAGRDQHRTFGIRAGKLLDINKGTVTLTDTTVQADVITDYDFDDLSPELKVLVVKEAKLQFQRYWGEDKAKDIQITQEAAKANASRASGNPSMKAPSSYYRGFEQFGPALAAQQPRQN